MKQTNTYIFVYASVMVIAVAAILSFAAMALKPFQEKNIEIERKKYILQSTNLTSGIDQASDKNEFVESKYDKYIANSFVIDTKGNIKEGIDAFNINMKFELSKPFDERVLPVYVCSMDDGTTKYIIAVRGNGLWGPLWGNISFNDDFNTIYGVVFDHKSETPGLGAEITQEFFTKPFSGKKIFNKSGKLVSINIYKGGKGAAEIAGDTDHGVDAISGGTITCKGVEKMLRDCLENYKSYLKNQNSN